MSSEGSGPQSASSTPATASGRVELPVLGAPVVRERADAARNRLRVLAAAERLFAERGVGGVTMDDVAAAAGVGKGTLYRRFTDKGGLAVALLDERERELQQLMLAGPPPLGPGADPVPRLVAFVQAYLRFLERHLDLVLLSETAAPGARLRTGAHAFWRQHCRYLLDRAGAPDADLRADVLLAALSAEQVRHWREDEERDAEGLTGSLAAVVSALAQPRPSGSAGA
jgi:AcrR family transcriptional regulator